MADGNLEDYRRRIAEMAAEANQRTRQEISRGREQRAHLPKCLDIETDTEEPDLNRAVIEKWDDGDGNTLFITAGQVALSQIPLLSKKIREQKQAFDALLEDDQMRIRTDFGSSEGIAATTTLPYNDYLQNEALRERFEKLKIENPPRPSGNK